MLNFLNSDRYRPLTLLPFGYFLATRGGAARDLGYLVLSSWLPAAWLLHRLGDLAPGAAVLTFAAGYLCFIAVYEIGYFVNDTWDAARSEGARHRIRFAHGPGYRAAFVSVRLAVGAGLGAALGWIGDPVWLAGFGALAATVAVYNLTRRSGFRAAAFFQMTCLRFLLPVLGAVPREKLFPLLFAAVAFYAFFRFLSYLESKDLLAMPDRRLPGWGIAQVATMAPMVLFVAFATGEAVLAELLAYFALVYGGYAALGRR